MVAFVEVCSRMNADGLSPSDSYFTMRMDDQGDLMELASRGWPIDKSREVKAPVDWESHSCDEPSLLLAQERNGLANLIGSCPSPHGGTG